MRKILMTAAFLTTLIISACDENAPGPKKTTAAWSIAYTVPGGHFPKADFSFLTPDEGWAVAGSKVLRYDGARWREFAVMGNPHAVVDNSCEAICALARDDVWVSGYFGTNVLADENIYHYDGDGWEPVSIPRTGTWFPHVSDLDFVAPDAGWACCSQGIYYYNGEGWTRQLEVPANALAMLSASNGWAIGTEDGHDEVYHWNGTTWAKQDVYRFFEGSYIGIINDIVFSAPNDGWVTGLVGPYYRGRLAHYDGNTWTAVALPGDVLQLNAAAFTSPTAGLITSDLEDLGPKAWWLNDGEFTKSPLPSEDMFIVACAIPAPGQAWMIAFPNEYKRMYSECYILHYESPLGK